MTTRPAPVILWFRQDLRLTDNPALDHALRTGRPLIPVYILDDGPAVRRIGAASRWWLDGSLRALDGDLQERGAPLILRRGDSEAELRRLIDETGADTVFMNRRFEPDAFVHDADIEPFADLLQRMGHFQRVLAALQLARAGDEDDALAAADADGALQAVLDVDDGVRLGHGELPGMRSWRRPLLRRL